jgi:hypothetical protein
MSQQTKSDIFSYKNATKYIVVSDYMVKMYVM